MKKHDKLINILRGVDLNGRNIKIVTEISYCSNNIERRSREEIAI